jgi:hypothetical protein
MIGVPVGEWGTTKYCCGSNCHMETRDLRAERQRLCTNAVCDLFDIPIDRDDGASINIERCGVQDVYNVPRHPHFTHGHRGDGDGGGAGSRGGRGSRGGGAGSSHHKRTEIEDTGDSGPRKKSRT